MRWRKLVIAVAMLAVLTGGLWWFISKPGSQGMQIVRVGLYENRPKIYRDEQGRPAGLFIDLLQAMARQESWQLQFVDCTWSECLGLVDAGAIDIMPDVALTEARDQRFDFHAIPVTHSWSGLWGRRDIRLRGLPDLDGRRIAVLDESVQEHALQQMMAGYGLRYTPVLINSLKEGFEAVVAGRADAVVSNSYFGGIHGSRYDLSETPIVFNPASLYYAAPVGRHAKLLERIDYYLERWRQDSTSPYFNALERAMVRPRETLVPEALLWILGAVIATALLLLILSGVLRRQVRRRTEELSRINYRLDHLLRASPVVLYQLRVRDEEITPVWISENLPRLFGFKPREVLQPNWWRKTVHPDDLDRAEAGVEQVREAGHVAQEYRIVDAHGQLRYIRDEMQYLPGQGVQQGEIVGSWSDLTEAQEQADHLRYLTNYDHLTGLPNRRLLSERLQESMQRAREDARAIALLYIDLDRFKHVNETLGYTVGDALLIDACERMKQVLCAGDILARIGGDEFVLILREGVDARFAAEVARRLLQRFSVPLRVEEQELVITISIGISLFPGDGRDNETLLRHAEIALSAAKKQGRNGLHFFSSSLSEGIRERLLLENDLRNAVERNELVLHYQPQIDLHSGELVGVEALLRWQHPLHGLLPPNQFIGLAEQIGVIGEIGFWVLQQACRQVVRWDENDCYIPRVAVNLAVQQIESGQLVRQVKSAMQEAGIQGERLELEVTESTIMREPDKATEAMHEFRELGIKLAIDDFGTGYSSLAYLKRLPLDRLKIDRSFVMDIGETVGSEAICRTIISLASSLDLETVAEGVEKQAHADFLRSEGCGIAQGYLYSKPLPPDELAEQCKALVKSSEFRVLST